MRFVFLVVLVAALCAVDSANVPAVFSVRIFETADGADRRAQVIRADGSTRSIVLLGANDSVLDSLARHFLCTKTSQVGSGAFAVLSDCADSEADVAREINIDVSGPFAIEGNPEFSWKGHHYNERPFLGPGSAEKYYPDAARKKGLSRFEHSTSSKPDPVKPYPLTMFDLTLDPFGWIDNWVKHHFGVIHPFLNYTQTPGDDGIYHLSSSPSAKRPLTRLQQKALADAGKRPSAKRAESGSNSQVRIGLSADWGSGTEEAAVVAKFLGASNPDFTIHGGDIYYVGLEEEISSNVFGVPPPNVTNGVLWPKGSIRSFALNGNHEMLSRGWGYFETLLPWMGQKASYFALVNEFWRIIGLDTGYHSYSGKSIESDNVTQPDAVIDWLKNTVNLGDPSDTRGVIFLSHHEFYSAFSSNFPETANQLSEIMPPNRDAIWFWGHEHRLGFYGPHSAPGVQPGFRVHGRCIGNGGYPVNVNFLPNDPQATNLIMYDSRLYIDEDAVDKLGFNGWTVLDFDGPTLTANYYSIAADPHRVNAPSWTNRTALVTEAFTVDSASGSVVLTYQQVHGKTMTVVDNQRDS